MKRLRTLRIALLLGLASLASCVAAPVLVDVETRSETTLEAALDVLARADVVFLGELHDSDQGHQFQLDAFNGLRERNGAGSILALEMFERDVQSELDAWLAGDLDRDQFLADSRPWGNYQRHYEPIVVAARDAGAPVIAANIPRILASRVVTEGVASIVDEEFAPRSIDAGREGPYRAKIVELMEENGVDADVARIDKVVASQCVKDDAMAESIADALARHPDRQVVVLLGAFHCEERLGTVERLARRRPDLDLVVVGMTGHGDRASDETDGLRRGRFVLYVGDSSSD